MPLHNKQIYNRNLKTEKEKVIVSLTKGTLYSFLYRWEMNCRKKKIERLFCGAKCGIL